MMESNFNRSWFYGMHEYGFGNTSFFSFLSEFNRSWVGLPYIEASVFIVLFVISLFGNVMVFYQIFKTKSTRTVTNCMISNLALADILFTSGSPLVAVARVSGTWILGNGVCKALIYLMFTCALVMIWTMTIISIDRHICINKTSSKKLTPRFAVAVTVITWLICLACFTPLALYFHIKEFPFGREHIVICTLSWPKTEGFRVSIFFTIILCLFGFFIPILIMIVNYFRILKRFCRTRRAITNGAGQGQTDRQNQTNSLKLRKNRDHRDIKVIKTLLLLVFLFLAMWFPIFVVFVVILVDGIDDKMQVPSVSLIITLAIALANACVNPFIYGVMNDKLRRAVIRCISCNRKSSDQTSGNPQDKGRGIKTISYCSQMSSNSVNTVR